MLCNIFSHNFHCLIIDSLSLMICNTQSCHFSHMIICDFTHIMFFASIHIPKNYVLKYFFDFFFFLYPKIDKIYKHKPQREENSWIWVTCEKIKMQITHKIKEQAHNESWKTYNSHNNNIFEQFPKCFFEKGHYFFEFLFHRFLK